MDTYKHSKDLIIFLLIPERVNPRTTHPPTHPPTSMITKNEYGNTKMKEWKHKDERSTQLSAGEAIAD
jgi:hypothetical protein